MGLELCEALSRNLRRIIYEEDVTQTEVAKKARINRVRFNEMVNGKQLPNVRTAWKIAMALGVTLNDLFDGADRVITNHKGGGGM